LWVLGFDKEGEFRVDASRGAVCIPPNLDYEGCTSYNGML
jgi:hypothetical protein